jgi:hypothetical protein
MSLSLTAEDRLIAATAEMAVLTKKLAASNRVKKVWPEAFLNGQRCALCGVVRGVHPITRQPKVVRRYLKRTDGVEFDITPEQRNFIRGTDE